MNVMFMKVMIIMTHLFPGELPDAGHSHSDGGVEVTPRHTPGHQDAQHHADAPSARRRVQMKHKGRKIRIKKPIQVSKNINGKYIYV